MQVGKRRDVHILKDMERDNLEQQDSASRIILK
jgi:hypothetical protein